MTDDTAEQIRTEIKDRIEFIENEIERGESVYENPECPHCGREMDFGASEGGTVRYGCYPPTGEGKQARDGYDCEFYQKYNTSYTTKKQSRDVNALKRALRELEAIERKVDRVMG